MVPSGCILQHVGFFLILWCTVLWYGVACGIVLCGTSCCMFLCRMCYNAWPCGVLYGGVVWCVVFCGTMWCCISFCVCVVSCVCGMYTVWYFIVMCCSVSYGTVLWKTLPHGFCIYWAEWNWTDEYSVSSGLSSTLSHRSSNSILFSLFCSSWDYNIMNAFTLPFPPTKPSICPSLLSFTFMASFFFVVMWAGG